MSKLKATRLARDLIVDRLNETYEVATQAQDDPASRALFKARSKQVSSLYTQFEKVHADLLTIVASSKDDVDSDGDNQIRRHVDKTYFSIMTLVEQMFPPTPVVSPQPSTPSTPSTTSTPQVKLPKITLPQFSGELKDWATFRDLFNSLIHNNPSLSNIEKFQYLLSSLSREPLKLVKTLPLSSDNYSIVYKSLQDRYDNKRALATYFWQQIRNLPNLIEDNSKSIRYCLDTLNENLEALSGLDLPVDQWDFILVNLILDKLDVSIRRPFEARCSGTDIPTFKDLKTFLSNHAQALESVSLHGRSTKKLNSSKSSKFDNNYSAPRSKASFVASTSSSPEGCLLCHAGHQLYKCKLFLDKPPNDRFRFVKDKRLCINCLRSSHQSSQCTASLCRQCNSKHHTLLHFNNSSSRNTPSTTSASASPASTSGVVDDSNQIINAMTNTLSNNVTVLLGTAVVHVKNSFNDYQPVRVLLDSASQASFITESCLLTLNRLKGLGNSSSVTSLGSATCSIKPVDNSGPTLSVDVIVIPKICADMPSHIIKVESWEHITNLKLADPRFHVPSKIDMLLGADVFASIVKNGQVSDQNNEPVALNTIFGWILMGKVHCSSSVEVNSFITSVDTCLTKVLKQFWELEEVALPQVSSPDDIRCEEIFNQSVRRSSTNRYIVSLPFRDIEPSFRDSRSLALRRFLSLERRLSRDADLRKLYVDFMQDYLDSGHMEPAKSPAHDQCYYIPHHSVLKPDSTTTKLRVVFDASAKLPNQPSLNDTLLTGAKLQADLFDLLIRFRYHLVVFTADVKQMYRQILISEHHRDYQRILWRFSPEEPIIDYRLNTVTYGVASAPFLALRTLQQLAFDEQANYPRASSLLASDVYVDDIVSGSNSIEEALAIKHQLIGLLQAGGFVLRKWASNSRSFVDSIPIPDRQESMSFDSESESTIKILGLQWLPIHDVFSYKVEVLARTCSKRIILSELARIFDPLGFVAPLTFFAKHLMQRLWCMGLDWDEAPPHDIITVWDQYKAQLPQLSSLQIPRRIFADQMISCELHGFCDASERGYAAVLYTRITEPNGTIKSFLVCAKSKVAPLKRISIPRLELCGAQLLAKLIRRLVNIYSRYISFDKVWAWTDSSIVLAWIYT